MQLFDVESLKQLYRPPKDSHKGMNGKLLVIGGSELFHASVFWAADVASRIVDLVHFSSPAMENNDLVRQRAKAGFWNGIVVPWERVEEYIAEDDCVVIGPGMPRESGEEKRDRDTGDVTNHLLGKFSTKNWVVDGGALQEMDVNLVPRTAILTPHKGEFAQLVQKTQQDIGELSLEDQVKLVAKILGCTILLKGVEDIVCSGGECDPNVCKPGECMKVNGGNEGMTKGGTGDVLAGLVGALYCKNEAMLAAVAGSYINKKAGDNLYKRMGPFFNASDLVNELPKVMKEELGYV
ncbi:MAG: NAD(P)H-hydrate dehydratase [Candidatus Chisholmbacteria bacterium]|nr:NAD(P)H-hydrate dehydratase [Candidatus Chisholmbacteria bacterium]